VLAVDPGTVRVGLALSDETATLASPLATIEAGPGAPDVIAKAASHAGAERVVVGLPVRMNGEEGPEALAARQLAKQISAQGLQVELWDERLTSRMAERSITPGKGRRGTGRRQVKARRERVDQVAAAILLQSYLDALRP
jgi:putative Holliday junction resolvase